MSSLTFSDIVRFDWSSLPLDLILSIIPYLLPCEILDLCLYNDSFNRRVCQNQDSIIWKMLFQRDISENVPRDHIASHYLDIMDEISSLNPEERLFYGAKNGYNEMVKAVLQDPSGRPQATLRPPSGREPRRVKTSQDEPSRADINAHNDYALLSAALKGHTETVKLLLDRGAKIHALNDLALKWAARNGHIETIKLLLDRGANLHAYNDEALRHTAENGRTETVKMLLDHGANIHALNDDALCWAALNGHTETVKVLLAYGPRAGSQAATITPEIRRMVEERGNPEIIALFNQS